MRFSVTALLAFLSTSLTAQQWTVVSPTPSWGTGARIGDRYLCIGREDGSIFEWDGGGWRKTGVHYGISQMSAVACDETNGDAVAVVAPGGGPQQTWIRRSGVWTQQAAVTPSVTALVFDPAGGHVMGVMTDVNRAPTRYFHWTGSAWTQLTPLTPTELTGAVFAADPVRGRVVAFGGMSITGVPLDLTWEWDGVDWRATNAVLRPPPQYSAAMAFDEAAGVMVMTSGHTSTGPVGQTWAWNGTAWSRFMTASNEPVGSRLFFDRTRGRLVLFGDWRRVAWEWAGADWHHLPQTETPLPLAASIDPVRGRVVALGDGGFLEYDGIAWRLLTASPSPWPRMNSQLAFVPATQGTLCFGGIDFVAQSMPSDTWQWDGRSWRQNVAGPRPPGRIYHGLAWHPASNGVILFGGGSAAGFLADTWLWNGVAWTDLTPALTVAPPPRYGIGLGLHAPTGELVLPPAVASETWLWNGAWRSVVPASSPPTPRSTQCAVHDPATQEYLAFGTFGSLRPEAWRWNGTTWSRHSVLPYGSAVATIDPMRRRLLLLSGEHYVFTPTPPGAAEFGVGCGTPAPHLDTFGGNPRIGVRDFSLRVSGASPQLAVLFLVDTAATSVVLPGGCVQLLPAPQFAGAVIPNAFGHARLALPIPLAPALLGLQVFAQAAAAVPQGPLFGLFALSQGLRLTMGD